jgi:Domain of unknown function DUF29
MSDIKTKTRPATAYETDFHAWARDQAERLRAQRYNELDWENIAEEIETLGRSEKREIESRLGVLVVHLLKWSRQPQQRKSGWRATIIEQRHRLARGAKENPSLADYPAPMLAEEYELARLKAADETGLVEEVFPETCPLTIKQVLDPDFWPNDSET